MVKFLDHTEYYCYGHLFLIFASFVASKQTEFSVYFESFDMLRSFLRGHKVGLSLRNLSSHAQVPKQVIFAVNHLC